MHTKQRIKAYCKRAADKAAKIMTDNYDREDVKTSAQDFLSDLLHLCNVKGWDFYEILDMARVHTNAETTGGEHG